MSMVLTAIFLGTRVALAYILSATVIGVTGIWWSVPVGWMYYLHMIKKKIN